MTGIGTKSGEIPVATADFTIDDVLRWARTKPAREHYRYNNFDNCALAQFSRHVGAPLHGRERELLEQSRAGMAACRNNTFGGLARELERIVEPSLRKRLWARLTGKPIGQPAIASTWTKPAAYLSEIETVNA